MVCGIEASYIPDTLVQYLVIVLARAPGYNYNIICWLGV